LGTLLLSAVKTEDAPRPTVKSIAERYPSLGVVADENENCKGMTNLGLNMKRSQTSSIATLLSKSPHRKTKNLVYISRNITPNRKPEVIITENDNKLPHPFSKSVDVISG
jgi:hypothetical protein